MRALVDATKDLIYYLGIMLETPLAYDISASRAAKEKNKKSKIIFVKKSTTLLQSHCCSLNGSEMASERRKGIIFKIGEKNVRERCGRRSLPPT